MYELFLPLFAILFIWILVGLPLTVARKAAVQNRKAHQAAPETPSEDRYPPVKQAAAPERMSTLTPTITEPDHDDSVFTGSLGAFSTEGFDPCHDEQVRDMEPVCKPGADHVPAPQAESGLRLGWTGNDVVRGVVMSEILNRKH